VTLPEVLIVVIVIGVLSGAITGVFMMILRTLPPTEARVDDARSLLGLTTWLPPDVNSTPMTPLSATDAAGASFDRRATTTPTCAGSVAGINVLRLSWTENHGGMTTYEANYRIVTTGSSSRMIRVACVDGGAASTVNLTADLAPAVTGAGRVVEPVEVTYRVSDAEGTEMVIGVAMSITTLAGDQLRVDTTSQNPAETLPPLATVVLDETTLPPVPTAESSTTSTVAGDPDETTEPPATDETTTTTIPCTASFVSISPESLRNTGIGTFGNVDGAGPLVRDVTVRITKSGGCDNLGLWYEHNEGIAGWQPMASVSQITLTRNNNELWLDGVRTLQLRDGQGISPPIILTAASLTIQ